MGITISAGARARPSASAFAGPGPPSETVDMLTSPLPSPPWAVVLGACRRSRPGELLPQPTPAGRRASASPAALVPEASLPRTAGVRSPSS
eukprot:3203131-Pleurochrysis_carterae.AAC.1